MIRIALILVLFASPALEAREYTRILPDQSRIAFSYSQMGVSVDGGFSQFEVQMAFDPARAEQARVRIEIPLASIDTGTEESDEEAREKTWFHMAAFPNAVFESTAVVPLNDQTYSLDGELAIKGIRREISVPVRFQPRGEQAEFSGEFTLLRNDFSIGEGIWARHGVLANEVVVRFHILAQP